MELHPATLSGDALSKADAECGSQLGEPGWRCGGGDCVRKVIHQILVLTPPVTRARATLCCIFSFRHVTMSDMDCRYQWCRIHDVLIRIRVRGSGVPLDSGSESCSYLLSLLRC
jgi:hypothetical protein